MTDEREQSEDRARLTEQHLDAIEWILAGLPDTEVAAIVGADRSTVYRWRRNEAFATELRRRHEARRMAIRERVEATDEDALDLVARNIENGNLQAAISYLRIRGARALSGIERAADGRDVDALLDRLADAIRREVTPEAWTRIAARVDAVAEESDRGGGAQ